MKKGLIYNAGVIYQNKIGSPTQDLSIADIRYLRDTFSEVVKKAETIESDRQTIIKKEITEEEKIKEINVLFEEEYEVALTVDIERLEKAWIKISIPELTLLESINNEN